MLYRGMDRAQLDTAYNNLAAVPSSIPTIIMLRTAGRGGRSGQPSL
ncbi:MAG TPA: hypothetical protein VFA50_08490 [Stellaceae bacterium]|nr:hypothetical protein [Stellaceae bacterium]